MFISAKTLRGSPKPLGFLLGIFPSGSEGQESACNARDVGSIPGLGKSLEKGMATHSSIPGESHVWRSLTGYSPWGRKKLGHD